ncbi:hypothetical protein RHGRI_019400 [Rhododendron griersonianum]|uniref:3-hydroxyisobutyryl-CoA hydrolase n=1 Tax=Rhododendron griersonianum TaxID=479676 RepID=A0AAV6JJU5_9ERIC|nr:hypothetical protein RHGRI_019400 [Rhododendron griersonianum]
MEPSNSTKGGADQVLVEGHSHAKKVVFNRPKQLNALSFQMVSRLLELFLACEGDHNVKLIILKGKGRAFCAGGDVATVVHDITEGKWKLGAEFFRIEYIMNYVMATYSKPQVFAMPETALGLFPDVGEYVGLTGTRLDGAEMLACGLATHFVPEVRLSLLEEALCNANSSDPAIISAIIDEFSQQPRLKEKSVYHLLDIINDFFSRRTVEEIILALEREAVNTNNGWISSTIKSLKTASPTSLKITLRSIREGRHQGVGQCLISEYRMVCHVMQGKVSKDFMEGCRAILLDKDKNPKWEPSKLELVSDEMVNRYFSKVDEEDVADLKLPTRSNLPAHAIAKL